MSYNITHWETKQIGGLVIPIRRLTVSRGHGCILSVQRRPGDVLVITPTEGGEIRGGRCKLDKEDALAVGAIRLRGEGSGTYYHEMLLPALKKSKGKLEAVLVWEGGEYINRLLVEDGQVAEEKVEL